MAIYGDTKNNLSFDEHALIMHEITQERSKKMVLRTKKKLTSLVLTGAMLVSTMAGLTVTASADTVADNAVTTYEITADSEITIPAGSTALVKGDGQGHAVTITCGANVNLTIEDLTVTAPYKEPDATSVDAKANIINFTSGNNTLNISGTSLIENDSAKTTGPNPQDPANFTGSLSGAAVRVPDGVTLNVTGDGTLYLYKHSMGAGFGSNTDEKSGTINFNQTGSIFAKGSMTGAVIGGDTGVGDVTINSGVLNIETNARGAGIGGSAQCNGGNVTINGGNTKITCAYDGHAIGSGGRASNGGTLTINGGSLLADKTANSSLTQLINATITDSKECLTLPIDSTFSGGDFTVTANDVQVYDGAVNLWQYVGSTTTTEANWTQSGASAVYLWLPTTSQTVTVRNTATSQYYIAIWNGSEWTIV